MVVVEELFFGFLRKREGVRELKMVSDKSIINFNVVLVGVFFVKEFGFLGGKYFETVNEIHFGFPLFKI